MADAPTESATPFGAPEKQGASPELDAQVADAFELLNASPVYRTLGVNPLLALARRATVIPFDPGQVLLEERQPGEVWYLLRNGVVAVRRRDLVGADVTLAELGRGRTFGERALLLNLPRSASVVATSAGSAYALDRTSFLATLLGFPEEFRRLSEYVELLEVDAFLKRASPFAHLPADAIAALAEALQPVTLAQGETLLREGEEGDLVYLVRTGLLSVEKRQRRVALLREGDVAGEIAALSHSRRTATVRALEPTELLCLKHSALIALLTDFPESRGPFRELLRVRYLGAPDQPLLLPDPVSTILPHLSPRRRTWYWVALIGGGMTFAVLTGLAAGTSDPVLLYPVLFFGAFLGPSIFVAHLATSKVLEESPYKLFATALLGAAIGLPLAFAIQRETGIAPGSLGPSAAIALVEEAAKVLSVLWLLRSTRLRFEMDGVLAGAAAGMGFAALENLMYGAARIDLGSTLLGTLWLRTILSPFTHGTWTALVCAAIWRSRATRGGSGRWLRVFLAFAAAVLLHTLWNWHPLPGILGLPWLVLVGAVSLQLLRLTTVRAISEEMGATLSLNPHLSSRGPAAISIKCASCGQVSHGGIRYCPRCGSALHLGQIKGRSVLSRIRRR